jgi:hypothetical protein
MKLITLTFVALGLGIATTAQASTGPGTINQIATPLNGGTHGTKVAQMAPIRCYQERDPYTGNYYTVCR